MLHVAHVTFTNVTTTSIQGRHIVVVVVTACHDGTAAQPVRRQAAPARFVTLVTTRRTPTDNGGRRCRWRQGGGRGGGRGGGQRRGTIGDATAT